jgi:hypothetical protein
MLVRWFASLVTAALLIGAAAASAQAPGTVPLKLFFGTQRWDNFTTATLAGEQDAVASGYRFVRVEGYVPQHPVPGGVPLKLFYGADRGDSFTTATPEGERDALAAGYRFVRVEGYVFRQQVAGTVPLKLYWSTPRRDNFTAATAEGERDALAAGYVSGRVEGYVYRTQVPDSQPLKLFFGTTHGDNFSTATADGERDARAVGYRLARIDALVLSQQAPGTVPLKLYYGAERDDNFTTATAEGERDAKAAGYVFVRVEGYVYREQAPGTVPFKLYWSERRRDNFTTATAAGERDALAAGYRFARVEGYVYLPTGAVVATTTAHPPAPPPPDKSARPATTVTNATIPVVVDSGRRVALVLGNGNYQFATKLPNPPNDAADIAQALRKLGFEVVEGRDLDRRATEDKLREFGRKLEGAKLALFFYAGHGMQVAGRNYLVPIDAKLERPGDLALDTVDLSNVLAEMESERRVNLIFLDACRDNPLAKALSRSLGTRSAAVGQGLALMQSAIGTMISFSTQPDNVALDGDGRNSPFTEALLHHIASPGLEVSSMMRRVRADVIAATREKQVPWDNTSLTGDVVLAR